MRHEQNCWKWTKEVLSNWFKNTPQPLNTPQPQQEAKGATEGDKK